MTTTIKIGERVEVRVPDSIPKGGPVAGRSARIFLDGEEVDQIISISLSFRADLEDVLRQVFMIRTIDGHHDVPTDFVNAVKAEGWQVEEHRAFMGDTGWKYKRRWL